MDTFAKRLKAVLEELLVTQAEFASRTGISPSIISEALNGKYGVDKGFPRDKLEKIKEVFPKVDINFLQKGGDGKPLIDPNNPHGKVGEPEVKYGGVPLWDHYAGAAMAALIKAPDKVKEADLIAKQACQYADAMLKERNLRLNGKKK